MNTSGGSTYRSKILDARPRSNCLNFHAVSDEIWPNNRLTDPLPLVWEILDLPLNT